MKKLIGNLQCGMYKVQMRLSIAFASLMCSPTVFALAEKKKGDGEQAVEDVLNTKGNGSFDGATKVTQGIGASGYALIRTVGAAVLIVSMVVLGLTVIFHSGNQQKQAESKSIGVNIVIGGSITFGIFGLIGVVVGIAGSF